MNGSIIGLKLKHQYFMLSLNRFEITALNSSLSGLASSLGSTPVRSSSNTLRLASLALLASPALSPTHQSECKATQSEKTNGQLIYICMYNVHS